MILAPFIARPMDQIEILASGWRANLAIALLMGKVTPSYLPFSHLSCCNNYHSKK
jgi:hypothetical protein